MGLWRTVSDYAAPREQHHNEQGILKLYRFLGKILAMPLILLPISANQVTILAVLSLYATAILFAMGKPITAIIVFYLAEILDYADGIVARERKSKENKYTSFTCGYISRFFHLTYTTFLFLGISIWIGYPWLGVIATMSQLVAAFVFFARMDVLYMNNQMPHQEHTKQSTPYSHLGVTSKFRRFGLKLAVLPMERIKEIVLIIVILYTQGVNLFPLFLLAYTVFLFIRAIIFTIVSYYFLKEKEEELTERGIYR